MTIQQPLSTLSSSYDDNEIVNLSRNAHLDDLLSARLSRRQTLRGGLGATAAALLDKVDRGCWMVMRDRLVGKCLGG